VEMGECQEVEVVLVELVAMVEMEAGVK